jgi:hypothetical protein
MTRTNALANYKLLPCLKLSSKQEKFSSYQAENPFHIRICVVPAYVKHVGFRKHTCKNHSHRHLEGQALLRHFGRVAAGVKCPNPMVVWNCLYPVPRFRWCTGCGGRWDVERIVCSVVWAGCSDRR